MPRWAYIYEHPDTDPVRDRTVLKSRSQTTFLVPVPSTADAPQAARQLIEDDAVESVELCGGFTLADASQVASNLPGNIPVGHVTYSIDAVAGAAVVAASFAAAEASLD